MISQLEAAGLPAPGGIAWMGIGVSCTQGVRRAHSVAGVRAARLCLLGCHHLPFTWGC